MAESKGLGVGTVAIVIAGGFIIAGILSMNSGVQKGLAEKPDAISGELPKPPARESIGCPVKLVNPRLVHDLEENISATVVNISKETITAISFGVTHTDKFGDTWQPYRTDLTAEHDILPGRSRKLNWEILMTTRTGKHGKPGESEMYLDRVAFANGKTYNILEIDDCDFHF